MPSGRLGVNDLPGAYAPITVYTCPVTTYAIVTVSICNRNATAVKVRIAVTANNPALVNEYVEYEVSIAGNGALERTGIVLATGQNIVVEAQFASCSCVVQGVETSTV